MFSSFLIAVIALIAMFYYSLRYSYTSRLEIKYSGTLDLKIDRDFVESGVASTNSSHKNSSIRASDKVYLLQESSRSKQSDQMIETGMLVTDNKNGRNRTSSDSLMNLSGDGSVATDKHKQNNSNNSVIDDAKVGVASNGSNAEQDLEENICPKDPSTLGESIFLNILVYFKVHLINYFQSPHSNQNGRRSVMIKVLIIIYMHKLIQMQNEIKNYSEEFTGHFHTYHFK